MATRAGVLQATFEEVAEALEDFVLAVLENAVDVVHREAQPAIRPEFSGDRERVAADVDRFQKSDGAHDRGKVAVISVGGRMMSGGLKAHNPAWQKITLMAGGCCGPSILHNPDQMLSPTMVALKQVRT